MKMMMVVTVLSMSLSLGAQEQEGVLPYGQVVLPLLLGEAVSEDHSWIPNEELFLEIEYRYKPGGDPVFVEPAEKVFWVKDHPILFLGATGDDLPSRLLGRGMVYIRALEGDVVCFEGPIHPRREKMRLHSENQHGKINMDMLKAIRLVEALTGEILVHQEGTSRTVSSSTMVKPRTTLEMRYRHLQKDYQNLRQEMEALKGLMIEKKCVDSSHPSKESRRTP